MSIVNTIFETFTLTSMAYATYFGYTNGHVLHNYCKTYSHYTKYADIIRTNYPFFTQDNEIISFKLFGGCIGAASGAYCWPLILPIASIDLYHRFKK